MKRIPKQEEPSATPVTRGAAPVWKMLPIKLLDPPDIAMRVHMDDEELSGLAASIRDTGMIYPICVYAEKGRFKIAAGHRRYLACKLLGRDEVECRDYTHTSIPPEQIKAHENLWRQPVNDGELMQWMVEEQERHPRSLEDLMRMTGKSEHWINTRMALQRGDEAVFKALLDGKINIAQAGELNKFPDDYRATYLQNCIESTPPANVLANWRRDITTMLSHQQPGSDIPAPIPVETLPGVSTPDTCTLCGEAHSPWTYKSYTAHQGCLDSIVKQLRGGS